jgi:hypothetical protein
MLSNAKDLKNAKPQCYKESLLKDKFISAIVCSKINKNNLNI